MDIERCVVDVSDQEYHVKDKEGNVSKYQVFMGHKLSPRAFTRQDLSTLVESIQNMHCRDDDVLLATFPKSGTNWTANIVSMLLHGNLDYVDAPPCLEYSSQEIIQSRPSPRMLFTHFPFEFFPTEIKAGKSRLIVVIRDPRDVMVSYFHFIMKFDKELRTYDGDWNGYFNFNMTKDVAGDTWFDNVKMWLSTIKQNPKRKILFLSYESMKSDLTKNVVKIAEYLGVKYDDSFYHDVARQCTFETMQPQVKLVMDPIWDWWKRKDNSLVYRKGEVGDWKNWFTVAQSEAFDRMCKQELENVDISPIYSPHLLQT